MPYTPPAQLSPATSKQATPVPSRSPSYIHHYAQPEFTFPAADSRPSLPRSAGSSSYLMKHRRSPSTPTGNELPSAMTDMQRGVSFDPHSSLRQSPPPLTNGTIPTQMNMSPPESTHNSPHTSDDEEIRGRSRQLEKENLAQLQAAIRGMRGERKSGSPTRRDSAASQINGKAHSEGSSPADDTRPQMHKRSSHTRGTSDPAIVFDQKPSHSYSHSQPVLIISRKDESDSDESETLGSRPPMIRKKSGELVKPALRPHSRRRPSSMPGTPTYSKAVHFDSQLEHIRHFLQVDRPLAVSAGSSPVENYESETEFPFGSEESKARTRVERDIRLANFPVESEERKALPVHVERVFLSADKKNLIGTVAVQNLAFQKQVTARFTLDYWKTTSEVAAEFSNDLRRPVADDNMDRFTFNVSLADQANLENKTLFFCVRYNVNGTEYWDSNNNMNYQVDFMKAPKVKTNAQQQPTGLGARPLNTLPRSRPSPATSNGRPKSMPVSFDDFGTDYSNFGVNFSTSPSAIMGEPKIKLRSPRSKSELIPDAPAARRNKSAAPIFGHRYDFNTSLSVAKSNAYSVLGDSSGLPPIITKQSDREVPAVAAKNVPVKSQKIANGINGTPVITTAPAVSAPAVTSKAPALFSDSPSLSSQSYKELVDKYCFFGTGKPSPPIDNKSISPTSTDGADDVSISDGSIGSPDSSGSSSPLLTETLPSTSSENASSKTITPILSRASSPLSFTGCGSYERTSSPLLGFQYRPSSAALSEPPLSTAILG